MIEDYAAWEGRVAQVRTTSASGAVLSIPMQVGERLVGVLNVADRREAPIGEDDIRLASLFADQAAMGDRERPVVGRRTPGSRRAGLSGGAHRHGDDAPGGRGAGGHVRQGPGGGNPTTAGQTGPRCRSWTQRAGEAEAVLAVGAWEATTGMRPHARPGDPGGGDIERAALPQRRTRPRRPRLARPELLQNLPAVACASR